MAKTSGLGKGLEALLGGVSTPVQISREEVQNTSAGKEEESSLRLLDVAISRIDPNPDQPRKDFDEARLKELSQSIAASGIIQPLVVKQNGRRYSIVAGERRWRAARLAGLTNVPVIVSQFDETQLLEVALIENLQRADLNPVEEAAGYRLLMQQHDLTQEEMANRLGKSRSAIANTIRLLALPSAVLAKLREGALSAGHARCLVGIDDPVLQIRLADEIVEKRLSVRQAEALAKSAQRPASGERRKNMTPELFDVQNQLQNRLETKVKITGDTKRGRIVIDYYTGEQLEQIFTHINREM